MGGTGRGRAWLGELDGFRELDRREGLSAGWMALVLLVAAVAVFSRRPSLFLHAQFYAEDGRAWFADAYNQGWLRSLRLPEGGYLNTMQRLCAGAALVVPFRWAPLAMAVCGLVAQCAPVAVLLSARSRRLGPLSVRVLMVMLYLAQGNAGEIHVVLTNSQWHFALVELLLAFACAPRSWVGRTVDVVVFTLGGVSGPFGLLLLPLLGVFWYVRRQGWSLVQAGLLGVGCAVQVGVMTHSSRSLMPLGASVHGLVRMVGLRVVVGALLGGHQPLERLPMGVLGVMILLGLAVWGYTVWFAEVELKLLVVFSLLLLAVSLRNPLTMQDVPAWQVLEIHGLQVRYWFYPMLTLVWSLLWCGYAGRERWVRLAGKALVGLALVSGLAGWRYLPLADLNFPAEAARFEAAQAGETVRLEIPPGWTMVLIKKGR